MGFNIRSSSLDDRLLIDILKVLTANTIPTFYGMEVEVISVADLPLTVLIIKIYEPMV